jgi:hypothetical protein
MIIECTRCGSTKYLPEPVSYSNVYICRNCNTVLSLPKEEKPSKSDRRKNLIIAAQQAMLMLAITIILISTLGTKVASAKSEEEPASHLESIIAVLSGAPINTVTLIDDVQGVVAQYERSIVSESVQLMRIVEGVQDVPPTTQPTNDMTCFPTPQNPLFPEYLNWKYSQFDYTVDRYGIVSLGTDNLTDNTYH